MQDTTEKFYTLGKASKLFPAADGKSVSTPTLWRWCVKGVGPRRIKLRYLRLGRKIVVSEAAVREFLQAMTEADTPEPAPARPSGPRPPSPSVRAKQIADADARCRAAGL